MKALAAAVLTAMLAASWAEAAPLATGIGPDTAPAPIAADDDKDKDKDKEKKGD